MDQAGPPLVRLAAVASATPPYEADQPQAEDFFVRHFAQQLSARSLGLLRRFLAHPSIRRRCFALDRPDCLVSENPDQRMARFTHRALELSVRAGREALARAGLAPEEVGALVISTCTGYLCPGLSSYLLERLNLPRNIRAYDLSGQRLRRSAPQSPVGPGVSAGRREGRGPVRLGGDLQRYLPHGGRPEPDSLQCPVRPTGRRLRSSGPGPGGWS